MMPNKEEKIEEMVYHSAHRPGLVYDFVTVCSSMNGIPKAYSPELTLTMTEASTVEEIAEHPGVTAAQLCKKWNRTRGALSQLLKKLEQKGFICREKCEDNDRMQLLYPTVKGMQLHRMMEVNEKKYHVELFSELLERGCSREEIEAFYKVMAGYTDVLQARQDLRWNNILPQAGK
ncbi:MarR family winged helix-turn-helix transcriptional regulator [uncultured Ruthenibacterium sp.]|uniref:MarR family winged helix-turn-helix transcriptional regulator n=1 Tax=uncultured Ruthenibacterium sp. TaxID=1905347 RepID=UPI00349EE415